MRGLTYIVVDEIVGGTVGLSLSPWPEADEEGRLRFDTDRDPRRVVVNVATLCEFLRENHLKFSEPGTGKEDQRELRIGDAFAARVRATGATRWGRPLQRWIEGRIHDISADARLVAKLAHYGAVTERWTEGKAKRYGLTELRE